ncbi:SLC13 family permease [Fervidobacterium sp.]
MTYAFVIYFVMGGKLNKALVTMLGALFLLAIRVFHDPYEGFRESLDLNAIFFHIGMVLFIKVVEQTGLFQYLAVKTIKLTGKSISTLFFSLLFLVGIISALVDNVTTILIFIPITLAICDFLEIEPVPLVMAEIIASNIGGMTTPIGDPPNVLITSAAKIPFTDFTKIMLPIGMSLLLIVSFAVLLVYRKEVRVGNLHFLLKGLDENKAVTDKKRFIAGTFLTILVITLFIFQKQTKLETSIIGLIAGFLAVLLFDKHRVNELLEKIEWEVIFFMVGIFIITGAMDHVGIMKDISNFLVKISSGSLFILSSVIVWVSGLISGFIDNILYTATMIPIIRELPEVYPELTQIYPLWYALSLGVSLGGNLTPIGSTSNIVALTLLKNYKNTEIPFLKFLKFTVFFVLITLLVSNIYMLLLLNLVF